MFYSRIEEKTIREKTTQYLVWEAEGLGQFADLTQSAEILV